MYLYTQRGGEAAQKIFAPGAGGAFLSAWIDFDGSGIWGDEPDEFIIRNQYVPGSDLYTYTFPVPTTVQPEVFARFRVDTHGGLTPFGHAADGEVEDYSLAMDFGDAPDPTYPTLLANDGARHNLVPNGPSLGERVDPDLDGQPSDLADGDDVGDGADDEDGVVFQTMPLVAGTSGEVGVTVNVPAPAMTDDSHFGHSVSTDGEWAIVGAPDRPHSGNPSGSVYIGRLASWGPEEKSGEGPGDAFGTSVSLSGDWAIAGAPDNMNSGVRSGSAWLYHYDGTSWSDADLIVAGDTPSKKVGQSVCIDGDVAIVGAPGGQNGGIETGSAFIYRFDGTTWRLDTNGELSAPDGGEGDNFGYSVSISGDWAVVGAPDNMNSGQRSGSAWFYHYDGTSWGYASIVFTGDTLGNKVGQSVCVDGDLAIVGAPGGQNSGIETGAASIYRFDGTTWRQDTNGELPAPDGGEGDNFGYSVSISGDRAVVGSPDNRNSGMRSGSAWFYHYDGTSWVEETKLIADDAAEGDSFGYAVALSGEVTLVGARSDGDGDTGSVYLYTQGGAEAAQKIFAPGVGGAFLNAWVDFDGSGIWGDGPDEFIIRNQYVPGSDLYTYIFPVPTTVQPEVFARFRVDTGGDLMPFGYVEDGEVEDYMVEIEPGISVTLRIPDLVSGPLGDTGLLDDDNLTNRDNDADRTLEFDLSGTVIGAVVNIYADGILIGSELATGPVTTVRTNGTTDLTDGEHSITARQTEPSKPESADSAPLNITVDTAGPQVTQVFAAGTAWTAGFLAAVGDDRGWAVPDGADQLKSLPWANLDEFTIVMDEEVVVAGDDLGVYGVATHEYAMDPAGFSYPDPDGPAGLTATWKLTAPVSLADKLLLVLSSDSVTDVAGNALDGGWANNADTYNSGDGAAGGDFAFRVNILPGDVNQSGGRVTALDWILTRARTNLRPGDVGYEPLYDSNGSGGMTALDWILARVRTNTQLPVGEPTRPITGVSAAASSQLPHTPAERLTDGSGLIDGSHSTFYGDMWLSEPGASPTVQFDLGGTRTLVSMDVWNYNQVSGTGVPLTNRGVQTADVYVSTSGIGDPGSNPTEWTLLADDLLFAQATGDADYAGQSYALSVAGVEARFVLLTEMTNWGGTNTGLSEVRFRASS